MNLLITNDDGWGFGGINALEQVASKYGTVWVVAPSQPMSGISHQVTFERPMNFVNKSTRSFSLDGTPADCVRVAMTQLGVTFDWVLSGINKGANLGADIYVSGTVAAAREASLFRCRAIAFSQHLREFKAPLDWSGPTQMAARMLPELLDSDLEAGHWLNVNFPDSGGGAVDSVTIAETENDRIPLPADYATLDNGQLVYASVYNDRLRTAGCDVDLCFSGAATITHH